MSGNQPTSEDLWAQALEKLNDKDKTTIDFDCADKLQALVELRALTDHAREECIRKRWKYVRGGKTVVLRDVFGKIIYWIDLFKKIGDATSSASSDARAGLAWLGVRFLLQIAVNDVQRYAFVVEGAELISRLIDRYTVFETLYLHDSTSAADNQLREALIRLYACILKYLAKAKAYYEQNALTRIVVGAIVLNEDFKKLLDDIEQEQIHVDRCATIVDAEYRDMQNSVLSALLSGQEAVRKSLFELIGDMDGPINRMEGQVSEIQDHLEQSKRLDILRWISPLPYQEYHDQHHHSVLEGTGKWLLTDPVYMNWKDDSTSSLLWLHGTPGCGKSKLVAIVTEELLQGYKEGHNPLPAFFYCSRNTAELERARPDDILASIARQLSGQGIPGSPLCQPTIDRYSEDLGLHPTKISPERVLPLIQKLVGLRSVTYIIIDALDECDSATRCDLLDMLNELVQDPLNLVKVFVSSRDDQDIVDTLRDAPSISVTSQKNGTDLANFVIHETENLVSKRRLLRFSEEKEVLKDLIIRKLIEGADGMFLWVTLQLEVLCRLKLDDDIRDRLGRLPSRLAQLYSEILEQMDLAEETRLTTEAILKWLLCAQRTLLTPEFLAAISLNPRRWREGRQPQRLFTKEQVLDLCCNLVIYDDDLDTFRFAHLSVREFLEQRLKYSVSSSNALAAETCLAEIIHSADIPSTKYFFSSTYGIDISCTSLPTTNALHKYAIYFWPGHCAYAATERDSKSGLQEAFRFFMLDGSGDGCPLDIWVQSRRRKKFETSGGHRLVRLLEDYPNLATRSFFVACTYGFCDIIRIRLPELSKTLKQSGLMLAAEFQQLEALQLLQTDPEMEITEDMVVQIARFWDNAAEILPAILARSQLRITEFILHQASNASDAEVMRILLDHAGNANEITDDVLQMAAFWGTPKMMELLLDRLGSNGKISEDMMGSAAKHNLPVLRVLLRRGGNSSITDYVIKMAAQNYRQGRDVLQLFESHSAEIIPTDDLMNAAASHGVTSTMLFLLSKGGRITEDTLKSAARNDKLGTEILEMLFDHWDGIFVDDQEILEIAAGNFHEGERLLRLLFEKLSSPRVTPSIMKAGASNPWVAEEVLGLLLERGGQLQVTPEVIIAAAHKPGKHHTEVVSMLLSKGENIEITEEVLVAVVESVDYEEFVKTMLENVPITLITDAVLQAGLQNYSSAGTMTMMLFGRVGKERVTPELIKACVGNSKSGMDAFAVLENLSGPIEATDELLRAAAKTGSRRMLQTLLNCLPNTEVSEDLMIAAASNSDMEIMMFLLDGGGYACVTDEVLKIVLAERYDVYESLPILLQRGGIRSISEPVAKAAVESRQMFTDRRRAVKTLLNQSQADVQITDSVVAAAVANREFLGENLIQFLLQYCADRNIPLSVDYMASDIH